jgi:spermidine dehydrogenase
LWPLLCTIATEDGGTEAAPVKQDRERQAQDRTLGMDRPILRRDVLNGAALTAGALLTAPARGAEVPPQDQPGYYPPTRTGLRGSHPGSFEAAHRLRDGALKLPATLDADAEYYDLIVVGGGISGLAAAAFYRSARPNARILILDNHDDFGGHARRNEFHLDGRLELMNGGTWAIDSPRPYGVVAAGLLRRLGIDPVQLDARCTRKGYYRSVGLGRGIFFDRDTFGADKLVVGAKAKPWPVVLRDAPLSPAVKADIVRIYEAKQDYLPGLSSDAKKARLARMSYADFLVSVIGADRGVLPYFQAMTHDEWGVGIDAVGALEVWAFDFPGFQGMGLQPGAAPHMGFTAAGYAQTGGSAHFHFPDGNASIARLLVRHLVPAALPGHDAEDVVTARADYSRLDRAENSVRVRLGSTVLRARNLGDAQAARGIEVIYARDGRLHGVRAAAAVLACWNMMIPYLCPELPARQRAALHSLVKTPLVYTTVALRNWHAFQKLGIASVYAPGSYHTSIDLNEVVDIGGYRSVRSPDEPILVQMTRTPCKPGLDQRAQNRAGQADLLATSFATFERNIRDQLARTLSPGGFDPAVDITAITVNRWPHGYAYEYNPLFDPDWDEPDLPHVVGRAPFGRITIANSDSGAGAYTDVAIDQAWRAVNEVLAITG